MYFRTDWGPGDHLLRWFPIFLNHRILLNQTLGGSAVPKASRSTAALADGSRQTWKPATGARLWGGVRLHAKPSKAIWGRMTHRFVHLHLFNWPSFPGGPKCVISIGWFSPNNTVRMMLLLAPFDRWRDGGKEILSSSLSCEEAEPGSTPSDSSLVYIVA